MLVKQYRLKFFNNYYYLVAFNMRVCVMQRHSTVGAPNEHKTRRTLGKDAHFSRNRQEPDGRKVSLHVSGTCRIVGVMSLYPTYHSFKGNKAKQI